MSNYEWIKDLKQGDTVYHCRGLKGYGNAINARVAAEFITAFMERHH